MSVCFYFSFLNRVHSRKRNELINLYWWGARVSCIARFEASIGRKLRKKSDNDTVDIVTGAVSSVEINKR